MHCLLGSIAVVAFLAVVRSQEPTPLPVMAKVVVHMGEARLLSGEDVQLTCSVPDDPEANWSYHWFRNGQRLRITKVLDVSNAAVQQGGNYTCQGEKPIESWPYSLLSLVSEPFSVHVDGGWVLLRVPAKPLLIEEAMTLTCRIRDDPMVVDVIFYKDGIEIPKQRNKDLVFTSLTLKDQGYYWCRATWVQRFEYHSAQSQPAYVTVLDKLSTPVLQLEPEDSPLMTGHTVVLRCVTQLNVKETGHSIDYYFYKDEDRMGPSTSQNTYTIQRMEEDDTGFYTCRAAVRALKLERWSAPLELRISK